MIARGIVLVVNPRATRVDGGLPARVADALRPHGLLRTVVAEDAAATREAAVRARQANVGVVAVVGGDGTVQAVAEVLAGGTTALLPVAGGSTNVLARGLGWPQRAVDALPLLGPALRAGPRDIRLARIRLDGGPWRTVCVNAGVGIDAATVRWVEDHPATKRRLRQAAFAAAAVGPGARALVTGPALYVSVEGTPSVRCSSVLVACGRPYAYVQGTAMDVLPRADWGGRLEWAGVRPGSPAAAVRAVVAGVRGRGPAATPGVLGGLTEGTIRVGAARPVAVQADGEPLGWAQEVDIRPGDTLRVIVPANAVGRPPASGSP